MSEPIFEQYLLCNVGYRPSKGKTSSNELRSETIYVDWSSVQTRKFSWSMKTRSFVQRHLADVFPSKFDFKNAEVLAFQQVLISSETLPVCTRGEENWLNTCCRGAYSTREDDKENVSTKTSSSIRSLTHLDFRKYFSPRRTIHGMIDSSDNESPVNEKSVFRFVCVQIQLIGQIGADNASWRLNANSYERKKNHIYSGIVTETGETQIAYLRAESFSCVPCISCESQFQFLRLWNPSRKFSKGR